jgi:hypothetical protein
VTDAAAALLNDQLMKANDQLVMTANVMASNVISANEK